MNAHSIPALCLAAALGVGCDRPPQPPAQERGREEVELRYRFEPGQVLRYESETIERGVAEVTITIRSTWRVVSVEDGVARLQVTVEDYAQRIDPPRHLPDDTARLNRAQGMRFDLSVSIEDGEVRHLGEHGLPEVGEGAVVGLRAALAGHIVRLPAEPVHRGQRWQTERRPNAPLEGAVTTRSRWRVVSLGPQVELACLSTMEGAPTRIDGGTALRTVTEFHYTYTFDAARGRLASIISRGSATVAPGVSALTERATFEGSLRLLPE